MQPWARMTAIPSHKRLTSREEYMMKLELESITKFYGKYPALQNVSATLTEGVYGLLGPNGAGKTTLINILIGILPASSGVIHLDGENTVQMGGRYFDQIGYMPQYPQFYANFTVQEFLDYMCQVKGVANAKRASTRRWFSSIWRKTAASGSGRCPVG